MFGFGVGSSGEHAGGNGLFPAPPTGVSWPASWARGSGSFWPARVARIGRLHEGERRRLAVHEHCADGHVRPVLRVRRRALEVEAEVRQALRRLVGENDVGPRQEEVGLGVVVQEDVRVEAHVAAVPGLRVDVGSERRERVCAGRAFRGRRRTDEGHARTGGGADPEMALRGRAALSRTGDERVRPVVEHGRQPHANAVHDQVVCRQADGGPPDSDWWAPDAEQMHDDEAGSRGASLVHDGSAEHERASRPGFGRRRVEPRHDDARARRKSVRREQRRQRHGRGEWCRRPSPGNERRRQRHQQRHTHRRQRPPNGHCSPFARSGAVYLPPAGRCQAAAKRSASPGRSWPASHRSSAATTASTG